ncbi:MAG: DNA-directed RNA polymerase subunit omega [Clostridiaceae bacterium]|nr:DNA-directed RNA polymerase subunit omega [Clostridiaceae bacterium]
MINPPISSLLDKVDSRYTLAILAARRARMLTNGEPRLIEIDSDKDVTIAMHEIKEGKVSYRRIERKSAVPEHTDDNSLSSSEE